MLASGMLHLWFERQPNNKEYKFVVYIAEDMKNNEPQFYYTHNTVDLF
jgi:hypothetical protein